MAEWLYEAGIGEARAALVEDGVILEARIDRDDGRLRTGTVIAARLGERLPNGRAWARLDHDRLILRAVPPGLTEGAALRLRITREAIAERGELRPSQAEAVDPITPLDPAPVLRDELARSGVPLVEVGALGPDRLEAAGWSELIEEAAGGDIAFPGGRLRLALTPAMTLIDVDGDLPAAALAIAGARASGEAIRRLGLAGSIGIDLPTLSSKAERQAAAAALDAALPQPFERTAVNGFGFLQLVRRRVRASLPELIQADPPLAAALALLRAAERGGGRGPRTLAAHPQVIAHLAARPDWQAALGARIGAPVALRQLAGATIWGGHVAAAHP